MLKGVFWRIALAFAVLTLGSASAVWCDTVGITLVSSGAGVYDYAISLPAGETITLNGSTGVYFSPPADSITFSGMSGVTGASASDVFTSDIFASSVTSGAVVFEELPDHSLTLYNNSSTTGLVGTLEIDSSVLTLGTVNWAFGGSNTFAGTVQGPVEAPATDVPEPSSLALLFIGLGGLAVNRRRVPRKSFKDAL